MRAYRSRRGATAVEFALTFPVIATMMIATMEFGWYFTRSNMVSAAVSEGVRRAAVARSPGTAESTAPAIVREMLEEVGFGCGGCTVDVALEGAGGLDLLVVEVIVPYEQLTGVLPAPGGALGSIGFKAPDTLRARAAVPYVGPEW